MTAPVTRPLAVPEPSTSRQFTSNRAIGGVLTSALVLSLVVAAGVTQMNSSADGSPTPVPGQLTASRTISINTVPPTVFVPSPTPVPVIQSSATAPPPSPSLPLTTATFTALPPTRTAQATNTAKPAPSSTPAPTHTPTPQPAIPPTTAPTQRPATLPPTAPPPPPATPKPATPKPTPRPVPGIGGTADDWNGWTVGVAAMTARQQINSQSGVVYAPSGTFWLIWIDARNDGTSTRSLGDTVDFLLQDGNGDLYTELSDHGYGGDTREIARIFGRAYLNTPVAPGGVTRTLLVFDIPSGATPNELIGRRIIGGSASLADPLRFDLTR